VVLADDLRFDGGCRQYSRKNEMLWRSRKNRGIKAIFPFEASELKTRRYLWIMPLWVVVCFLAMFGSMYALAFLSESALDHVLRWIGSTNK
jgi:hypothetical protein